MKLIITEKSIAGQRISEILSDGTAKAAREGNAQVISFERGGEDFLVIPLRGHIVDVDFPKQYSYWLGTDLKKLVAAPIEYIGKEKDIIEALGKKREEVDEVIIATDADREGESIGREALTFIEKTNKKTKVSRAYFSAITPQDIEEAFEKLKKLDYNYADSADCRREIDLVWGAVLTRYLSLVSGQLGKDFLSAGRVQTPVLAIIVQREKERFAFEKNKYWVLEAIFEKNKEKFYAEHKTGKFFDKQEAQKAFDKKTGKGTVTKVESKKRVLAKPVPFNTTEFLRAATTIGMTAGEAMSIAEQLYQQGFISYPRTDNTVFKKTIDLKTILLKLRDVKELSHLVDKIIALGKIEPSAGKKETTDHPPIYPVMPVQKEKLPEKQWKVYELVLRRFLAVLSTDAQTLNVTVDIDLNTEPFVAWGQTITKQGWKEFYPYSKLTETILPELKKGDTVNLIKLDMAEKETQPPARYSQSTLIKLMEQLGLGTKSTRHEIIQKLYSRRYIAGLKSVEPNKISFAVIDSLQKYAKTVTEPEMTSVLEKEMDEIAAGKKSKKEIVDKSTNYLTTILDRLLEHKNNIGQDLRNALQEDSIVGTCDKCGKGQLRKLKSKNQKWFLACNRYPECKTTYPLPQNGKVYATEKKCETCGKPVIKVVGKRFRYEMCIDHLCLSKKDWKKKDAKEPAEKKEPTESKGNGKKTNPKKS